MTVLLIAGGLLTAAAMGQALRIGLVRGDWRGFVPVAIIAAFVVAVYLLGLVARTED
jgi:hypothetical protein